MFRLLPKTKSENHLENVRRQFEANCSWAAQYELDQIYDLCNPLLRNSADPLYTAQRVWINMVRITADSEGLKDGYWRLCWLLDDLSDSQWSVLVERIYEYQEGCLVQAGKNDARVRVAYNCWYELFGNRFAFD